MATIYWAAPLLGRKPDSLSALAMAAIVILVAAPSQLFQAGFVLSFTVVTGLLLLYPLINAPLRRLIEPNPLRIQDEPTPVIFGRACLNYIVSVVALSVSAWLASAPLMAYYFGRFTPIGLIGNLLVVPLAFLVVVAGSLSLVLGSCVDFFAVTFNHTNIALVTFLIWCMKIIARIPYGSIRIANPSIWAVLLWYAILLAIVARCARRTPVAVP